MFGKNQNKIERILNPRTVAVIGASRDEKKVGNVIFRNLLASNAKVFPVNPNAQEIYGQKCYADVFEIPYELDLAIIAVKPEFILEIVRQAVRKTKNFIIISAGFSEIGNKELENDVLKIIRDNGGCLLGPNVLGIVNNVENLNMSYYSGRIEKGRTAFISQSGSMTVALADSSKDLGISYLFSVGNMIDIDFNDALEFLEKDGNTDTICMYIETLRDGRKFLELCKRIGKKKKLVALKAGRSEAGDKAVKSHTSSLATDSRIFSGIFKQAGIIEVKTLKEMLETAKAMQNYRMIGKRACIVGNAGGIGIQIVDCLTERGFEIPELPAEMREKLELRMSDAWSRGNPIDIIGDALAERYDFTLKSLDKEKWFDFFVVILTRQAMTEAEKTALILKSLKKPVVSAFVGDEKSVIRAKEILKQERIMNFEDFEELAKILEKIKG